MSRSEQPNRHASDRRPTGGSTLLWFGLLGGAIAWTLHLLLSYGLAESACATPLAELELLGASGLTVLLLGVSLLTALLAFGATVAAFAVWLRWRGQTEQGSAGFAGLAGLLLSGLFVFIILVQSLPVFFVGACG